MTEADWLRCKDPLILLRAESLFTPAQSLRIALALLGKVSHLLRHRQFHQMLSLFARHLQSPAEVELADLYDSTSLVWEAYFNQVHHFSSQAEHLACAALVQVPSVYLSQASLHSIVRYIWDALAEDGKSAFDTLPPRGRRAWKRKLRLSLCHLLHDVVPNPYSPPTLDPRWRSPLVLSIVSEAAASQDYSCLPVVADLLEDLGCPDALLLDHLRCFPEHVSGCWAVQLLLGRQGS